MTSPTAPVAPMIATLGSTKGPFHRRGRESTTFPPLAGPAGFGKGKVHRHPEAVAAGGPGPVAAGGAAVPGRTRPGPAPDHPRLAPRRPPRVPAPPAGILSEAVLAELP